MTLRYNSPAKATAGFTLIEMLVVLVILSMAMALSLPYASGGGGTMGLRADARILAAKLRQAREAALMKRIPTTVLVNLAPPGVTGPEGATYVFKAVKQVSVVTARGVSGDQKPAIVFEPNGGSTGGEIQLSADHHSAAIRVDWLTGAISVETASVK